MDEGIAVKAPIESFTMKEGHLSEAALPGRMIHVPLRCISASPLGEGLFEISVISTIANWIASQAKFTGTNVPSVWSRVLG